MKDKTDYKKLRESLSGVDFSKHEIIVSRSDNCLIHTIKLPDKEYHHRIVFINASDIMAVTGDFGNWIFCREFHPSAHGFVSPEYWLEKLTIGSCQKPRSYDPEGTRDEIQKGLDEDLEEYGYKDNDLETMKEYYKNLLFWVGSEEWVYVYQAYDNCMPGIITAEDVPLCEKTNPWLYAIFDAFNEICNRIEDGKFVEGEQDADEIQGIKKG